MKSMVSIPISGSRLIGQNVQVKFPDQCVYCGGRAETKITIDLYDKSPARGNKVVEYTTKLDLPYCHEHAELTRQLSNTYGNHMGIIIIAAIVIAILGWVLIGISSETFLIPIAIAGIIIALGNKILVTMNPKYRDLPVLFQQGELGARVKLNTTASSATRLDFWFTNADYAKKFAVDNSADVTTVK
jgi:hypothetical protein